jgi:hypothetical protein
MRAQDRQLDASADYCYAVLGFQDMELGYIGRTRKKKQS